MNAVCGLGAGGCRSWCNISSMKRHHVVQGTAVLQHTFHFNSIQFNFIIYQQREMSPDSTGYSSTATHMSVQFNSIQLNSSFKQEVITCMHKSLQM
jgi:hypothetical protein